MAMIHLKGDISARLVQDLLPMAPTPAPNVPWLELLIGSEQHADYVRLWPADPDKLDALAVRLGDLAEEERQRKVEVLKQRQNLREDHRGEVSMSGPISLDSGGVSAAIPLPPPEDAA